MRKTTLALLAAASLALLAGGAASAAGERRNPAVVTLAAELRESAAAGSAVLATLPAGQQVTVLEMRGRQARVDAAGRSGWMSTAKLRIGAAAPAAGGGSSEGGASWLRGLTGILGGGGGGSGGGDAKVPIGVRGLQKEDVARAEPDPEAVDRLEAWRASPDDGLAHAGAAGLDSFTVEYREAAAAPGRARASGVTASGSDN